MANKYMVLQLQEQLYNNEISTLEALRKALIISTKLELDDIEKWINQELNGYKNEKRPEYREVSGTFEARNPFHGWMPITDFGALKKIETVSLSQSIIELEGLIEDCKSGFVQINRNDLSKYLEIALPVRQNISIQQISKITETVKNKILSWTLELEKKGIKGENMSFSEKEKENVKELGGTINVYGDSSNLQIMQNSENSSQKIDVRNIKNELNSLIKKLEEGIQNSEFTSKISKETEIELKEEIETLKKEIEENNPNEKVINKSLNLMKEIFSKTSTSIIATGLVSLISKLFI